jgi:ankyrin repeat protein
MDKDRGNEEIVQLLLTRDVDADSREYQRTPLSYAAERGHKAIVQLLLTRDVNVDTRDRFQRTPLSYAARGGHKNVMKLLSEALNQESQD